MKELNFDGRLFLYDIMSHDCGEYGAFTRYTTDFYDTEQIITESKKFYFFGPIVKKISYRKLFTIDFSIESESVTRKKARAEIQHEVDLITRREEIKRGEFI